MNQWGLILLTSGLAGLAAAGIVWFGFDLAKIVLEALRARPEKSATDLAAEALLKQAKDRKEEE